MDYKNIMKMDKEELVQYTDKLYNECGIGDLSDIGDTLLKIETILACSNRLSDLDDHQYHLEEQDYTALKSAAHALHAAVLTLSMLDK